MAVVIAVVIAALIAASVLAPSPRRARPRCVAACGLVSLSAPPVMLLVEAGRGALTGSIAGAVALLAVATWLARGIDPGTGRDDDGSGRDRSPGPPPPWDWYEFDRARDDWTRSRTLV